MIREIELAPLLGVTDALFRSVFLRHFTEFSQALLPFAGVRAGASSVSGRFIRRQFSRVGVREVPQILNGDSKGFTALAHRFEEAGCTEVNLNAACPNRAVRRKGRGAALAENPDRLKGLLDRVLPRMRVPLSVKLRLPAGYPDGLIQALKSYPLERIILHPRTPEQGYAGRPLHSAFFRFAAALGRPVDYSGDLFHPRDSARLSAAAEREARQRGVCPSSLLSGRILLGRGAVANPFLAYDIAGKPRGEKEKLEAFWNFYYDLKTAAGGDGAKSLDRFKGLWAYWARSLRGGWNFHHDFVRSANWQEAELKTREFRKSLDGWQGLPGGYCWEP